MHQSQREKKLKKKKLKMWVRGQHEIGMRSEFGEE